MNAGLAAEKSALRKAMRAAREALDAEGRVSLTVAAVERLLELPAFARERLASRVIAGYVAVGGELSPAGALAFVRDQGGTVALPRVTDTAPRLRFHTVGADMRLRTGRFGLSEPPETAPEIRPGELAAMLVPGLAFDVAGRRVGFGGGYYDGVIEDARAGGAAIIGFAYDFQIVDRCPAGDEDRAVDLVVTDARVIRAAG
jgi:5-formyltetrahydrofolate cyclo-ligase